MLSQAAMEQESIDALPIQEPEVAVYSPLAKALRDNFVKQYLIDYDAVNAAVRIGYNRGIAKEYAARFMDEPYVIKQIQVQEIAPAEEDPKDLQKRIMAGLIREANYRGAGSSQAARVAALGKLAQLNGMEPATRNKTELTGADGEPLGAGTFVIPGLMTPEAWEEAARKQQETLVAATVPSSAPVESQSSGVVIR